MSMAKADIELDHLKNVDLDPPAIAAVLDDTTNGGVPSQTAKPVSNTINPDHRSTPAQQAIQPQLQSQLSGPVVRYIGFAVVIDYVSGPVRDFFALERTYLAYNRTASALASYAVIVGQLFILREERFVLGKTLASIMIFGAIAIDVIGIWRYFTQSHALIGSPKTESEFKNSVWRLLNWKTQGPTSSTSYALTATPYILLSGAIIAFVCVGMFVIQLVTT